jgi:hypothetical protein
VEYYFGQNCDESQRRREKNVKNGAYRSFESEVVGHLDKLRDAARLREPDRQVWLYLNAPTPDHPWRAAHGSACGWVEGAIIYDQGRAAYTIAGDVAYDAYGKPAYQIVGNWFLAYGTREGRMWADSDYETNGRRIPPWREAEVRTNAIAIVKAEQFKGALDVEADDAASDTTELCAWLRDRRDTPVHVLAAVGVLEQERAIVLRGTVEEKIRWFTKGPGVDGGGR